MEIKEDSDKLQHCLGCLCRSDADERLVQSYRVQNEALKSIFQTNNIMLCGVCQRFARRTELFIHNVQINQILLEKLRNQQIDSTFLKARSESQPILNLSNRQLDEVDISGTDLNEPEVCSQEFDNLSLGRPYNIQIKVEMKEENNDSFENHEEDFAYEIQESFPLMKSEAEVATKPTSKINTQIDTSDDEEWKCISIPSEQKVKKKCVKREFPKANGLQTTKDAVKAVKIAITQEECMAEMAEKLKDKRYLDCLFHCKDCVKGFNFKASYDKHMVEHSEENGKYECAICKKRFPSSIQRLRHKKYHQLRFKCTGCDFVRTCEKTVLDHYNVTHAQEPCMYPCPHCGKVFVRRGSLRQHTLNAHSTKERVQCAFCARTCANNVLLKIHLMNKHAKEVSSEKVNKRYPCPDCPKSFDSPSHLKKHANKHSTRREYYCVECDKNFSTSTSLRMHYTKVARHITKTELPLSCEQCDKRFVAKRDLERHMNKTHLNIRPFPCDKCDKAYLNNWSLKQHRRLTHEGYKRPMKFPCKMCDKVFNRVQILENHVRTHTGEKPFQCSECPSAFAQQSDLARHIRVIHQNLTRQGKPKVLGKLTLDPRDTVDFVKSSLIDNAN